MSMKYFGPPHYQRLAVVPTKYPWAIINRHDYYYKQGSLHVLCGASFPRFY